MKEDVVFITISQSQTVTSQVSVPSEPFDVPTPQVYEIRDVYQSQAMVSGGLMGRDRELATLNRLLHRYMSTGVGHTVVLEAHSGMGKSAFMAYLRGQTAAETEMIVLDAKVRGNGSRMGDWQGVVSDWVMIRLGCDTVAPKRMQNRRSRLATWSHRPGMPCSHPSPCCHAPRVCSKASATPWSPSPPGQSSSSRSSPTTPCSTEKTPGSGS